jgi:hypothetical protein
MNVSIFHNMISFVFIFLLRKSRSEASEKVSRLCERAFRSRVTLRKEGQVELLGETPVLLSASATLKESQLLVYTDLSLSGAVLHACASNSTTPSMKLDANVHRQFHFDECSWLSSARTTKRFLSPMRVSNPDYEWTQDKTSRLTPDVQVQQMR